MFRYRFLNFWFYIFLCILIYGCSVMPNEMKTAERLMETAPDSSLYILQHMSPDKYKSGSNRAFYGLLLIRALDKNLMPLKPDSLLDYSIKYYMAQGDELHLAACYFYKGRSYKNAVQYDKAMDFYLKALDHTQNKEDNPLLARIYLNIGDIYLIQRDYNLSRQKYKLAYENFTKAKFQNLAFYSLLNIGRSYHASKDYEKAQSYYQKIYTYTRDSLQKASLLQEIAINFYDNHKFDSAQVYFRQVIKYPYIGNNRAIRYYYFADLLFDLKQIDSAYYYAKNSFLYKPDIPTQRECYRIMTNADYLKGNMTEMSFYMNKYVALGDSLRKIDYQTKGSILESVHNTDNEIVKTRNKLWYLAGFFLLVIAVSLLFYSRYYRRNKLEKQQAEEMHIIQKAAIRKEVMLKYKATLHQRIETIRTEQSSIRKKASREEKETLDKKIYDEILHLNDVDTFFREMDTVLNNIVTKLKTQYPYFTPKEINWCCLHLLDVPTTDIYMLLDYKVDSLKKMRQRLAAKTGLSGVTDLDDFLNRILSE